MDARPSTTALNRWIEASTRVILGASANRPSGGWECAPMSSFPCLLRSLSPAGEARYALGDPLVDRYLEFVAGRCRPNTLTATAFDLKTFFTIVERDPVAVTSADVFEFLAAQRGDRRVVRISDRESGLSARTIARRLSTLSGFYAYLVARGDTAVAANPVPRGLATRRQAGSVTSQHGAVGAGAAHVAEDPVPSRRRRLDGCSAVVAGSGVGRSDAARWFASLRGARTAAQRHPRRRPAGVRRRRQGRPSTVHPDGQPFLRRRSATISTRNGWRRTRSGCSSC